MPTLLTPEQLDAVKKVIEKHHSALIFQLVGDDGLTEEERTLLEESGLKDKLDALRQSYLFGQAMAQNDVQKDMPFEDFLEWLKKNPVRLTTAENFAVRNAAIHAGAHIRHLGAKIVQQTNMEVFQEDAKARADILRTVVRPEVATNIRKRESIGALKFALGRRIEDWERDWNRVAITEKVNAMNQGVADSYRKNHGDPWVYKQPMPDACKHCLRLHIGPDGHPRIFKLSNLESNGTNVGVKAANWQPVVGAVHPHCQCQLIRVPAGWGFDADGDLSPDGKFGVRYESEDVAEKAAAAEDTLRKSLEVKDRFDFQGLPIAIEQRPGEIRSWRDRYGYEGYTRMTFAYGYIEGTVSPEGSEYDVFVGPDPSSPFVYVVHQTDRTTGTWEEDKALLGFPDPHTAKEAFLAHYDVDDFFGSMSILTIDDFRQRVLQTAVSGSLTSDGMVKSESDPSVAAFSPMGDRAVTQGTSGAQFYIGMDSPFAHLQAARPRVQITPEELGDEQTRKYQRRDRRFVVRTDPEEYLNPLRQAPLVHTIDPKSGPAQQIGIPALREIPRNRKLLEEEINRRLDRLSPNVVDPSASGQPHSFELSEEYDKQLMLRLDKLQRGEMVKATEASGKPSYEPQHVDKPRRTAASDLWAKVKKSWHVPETRTPLHFSSSARSSETAVNDTLEKVQK